MSVLFSKDVLCRVFLWISLPLSHTRPGLILLLMPLLLPMQVPIQNLDSARTGQIGTGLGFGGISLMSDVS